MPLTKTQRQNLFKNEGDKHRTRCKQLNRNLRRAKTENEKEKIRILMRLYKITEIPAEISLREAFNLKPGQK